MTLESIIEVIEQWDASATRAALASVKGTNLETELSTRYGGLLKFAKAKGLSDLATLPSLLSSKKIAVKKWKPDELSQEILATIPVKEINIGYTKLKKLPPWIQYLKKIEKLDIGGNPLGELPEFIFGLSDLKNLNLSGIGLKELSEDIAKLQNLEDLSLFMYEGDSVPAGLEKLPKLKTLNLGRTNNISLEALEAVGKLKSLEVLYMSDYPYERFPKAFASLENLEYIQFQFCELWNKFFFNFDSANPDFSIYKRNKDAVADLVRIAAKTEEEYGNEDLVYSYLESEDETIIQKGLDILKIDSELLKKVEKRYLHFIRARLNDEKASMDDWLKVKPTAEQIELLYKRIKSGNYVLSFEHLKEEDTKFIFDFLGALTKNAFDVDVFISEAKNTNSLQELKDLNSEYTLTLLKYMQTEFARGLLSKGWFQWFLQYFSSNIRFRLNAVNFNHTEMANSSVLKEFMLFVNLNNANRDGGLYIDIFQSGVFDLTEVFWLLRDTPRTMWSDGSSNLPKSILSFEREAKCQVGDQWKNVKSTS